MPVPCHFVEEGYIHTACGINIMRQPMDSSRFNYAHVTPTAGRDDIIERCVTCQPCLDKVKPGLTIHRLVEKRARELAEQMIKERIPPAVEHVETDSFEPGRKVEV